MSDLAPLDESITLQQLDEDPYPIYQRLRNEAPVLRVKATGRTMLTKAEDTKYVKDNPELFSSDDPNTPMKRAFQAHTLMRKDGEAHMRERMAMAPAFSPKVIHTDWMPQYMRVAKEYVARLPRGEIVDLFPALSGPYAARGLGILLGIEEASDDDLQRWSQTLIDAAGNFGWRDEPFEKSDTANAEMNTLFDSLPERHLADGVRRVRHLLLAPVLEHRRRLLPARSRRSVLRQRLHLLPERPRVPRLGIQLERDDAVRRPRRQPLVAGPPDLQARF